MLRTRIPEVLAAEGRKASWFCRQIGMDQALFSRIKAGVRPFPARYITKSCQVLGRPFEELFYDDEDGEDEAQQAA